ncbi:MAG: ATP-grasp domain-containing protein [Bacteroidales bacterium]|nr:ATP-grasp domain-containing protein [Bacteroidales bacterium]MDE6230122.1 ATP-grasp domain-containing protein [Muribaculaceae bacterium]
MDITILMLGGSRRVSLAELFQRSGKRLGYNVRILAYELDTRAPIALVGKVIKGLKWSDPNVVDDIVRVVKEYDVNIILPFVNGAMEIAALCKARLPEVFVPVSDYDLSEKLYDKIEAARLFKEAGIPIPRTYSILDNEMPAIAKPRRGSRSRGIKIFNDVDDLMHLENLDDYIIQEYIGNTREYTVDCYVSLSGELLTAVPRERLEIMGGESTRTVTCRLPELLDLTRKVIESFPFRGPVTIQFLHDLDTDRFLLLEVVTRLGGGVICSIYAGAPITDYILSEALGIPVSPCDDWADNVLMARYWKEAIFYNATPPDGVAPRSENWL